MSIEKERKFLLKELPENFNEMDIFADYEIEQGYLMFGDDKELRVRIIKGRWHNETMITYKSKIDETSRNEYEYRIPMKDAISLMNSTKIKLKKRRRMVEVDGLEITIDDYPNGLRIAEIEYTDELVKIPGWLGEDVTNNKMYSNLEIALLNNINNL